MTYRMHRCRRGERQKHTVQETKFTLGWLVVTVQDDSEQIPNSDVCELWAENLIYHG